MRLRRRSDVDARCELGRRDAHGAIMTAAATTLPRLRGDSRQDKRICLASAHQRRRYRDGRADNWRKCFASSIRTISPYLALADATV